MEESTPTTPTPPPSQEEEFTSSSFSIPIHNLITTSQNSHGLLHHSDYSQYRSYCTRRLSRLRHAPPVRKDLTHSSKSTNASSSSSSSTTKARHGFYKRPKLTAEIANAHVNFVLVGLFAVERSWTHAMELRSDYELLLSEHKHRKRNVGGGGGSRKKGKSPGSVRQHYLKRLKKARDQVTELEGLVGRVCDEGTAVEMKAYASWMRGNWYCEVKDWKNACQEYGIAFHLCQALAKTTADETTTTTTSDETKQAEAEALQRSDLFTSRATNTLQPLLRYCQYELQQDERNDNDGSTTDNTSIAEEDVLSKTLLNTAAAAEGDATIQSFLQKKLDRIKQSKLEKEANSTGTEMTVAFRSRNVRIENSSLHVTLLQIQEWAAEYSTTTTTTTRDRKTKRKEAKFLQLLDGYDDAISIVETDLRNFSEMKSGPAVNRKKMDRRSLLGYCKYEKLKLLMGRSEGLVNELRGRDVEVGRGEEKDGEDAKYKRVEEIAHLYDALLQEARAVTLLPGGPSSEDGGDGVEVEDEFALEANANVLRIRALRCYYVGRMYAADTVGKYREAIALFDQASLLASEAAEEISACQDDMEDGTRKDEEDQVQSMIDLEYEITGAKCRAEACALLAKLGSGASSATTGMSLLRRLDDFDSGGKTHRLADVPPSLESMACKPMFFDIANNYAGDFPLEELQKHMDVYRKGQSGRGFFGKWFGGGS